MMFGRTKGRVDDCTATEMEAAELGQVGIKSSVLDILSASCS